MMVPDHGSEFCAQRVPRRKRRIGRPRQKWTIAYHSQAGSRLGGARPQELQLYETGDARAVHVIASARAHHAPRNRP